MHDVKVTSNEVCNPAQTTCLDTTIVKSEDRYKKFVPKQRVCDLHDKFCETFPDVINDEKKKHDMPSTQLREMQKRRSLLVLKAIKKTSFISPNKCIQRIRM